jgi:RNA-binding protein NOB1
MEAPHTEPPAQEAPTSSPATSAPITEPASEAAAAPSKPVHSLVIDANAIINNEPSVSTLLAQAEELFTIPAVVSESALVCVPPLPKTRL